MIHWFVIAIMLAIIGGLAIAIWKVEIIKELAKFLGFGLLLSLGMVMIGRIWIPNLSAWWVIVIEIVLVIVVLLRRKYSDE
jgi:hypothetical protein